MLNTFLESACNKLEVLKKKLHDCRASFEIYVENHLYSGGCFEKNAINDLMVMADLKAEIKQLEEEVNLLRLQIMLSKYSDHKELNSSQEEGEQNENKI